MILYETLKVYLNPRTKKYIAVWQSLDVVNALVCLRLGSHMCGHGHGGSPEPNAFLLTDSDAIWVWIFTRICTWAGPKNTQDTFQNSTVAAPHRCEPAPLNAGHIHMLCELDAVKSTSNLHIYEASLKHILLRYQQCDQVSGLSTKIVFSCVKVQLHCNIQYAIN